MIVLLRRHLRPYPGLLLLVLGALTLQSGLNLWLPTLNADVIDEGVVPGDVRRILVLGAAMLGVTVALGACSVVTVWAGTVLTLRVGRDLRADLFRRTCTYSPADVAHFTVASLVTRVTNDVQHVESSLGLLLSSTLLAPVTVVTGVVLALRASPPLAALLLVVVPLMAVATGLLMLRSLPLLHELRQRVDEVARLTREQVAGVRVIRAFVRTAAARARFGEADTELVRTAVRLHTLFATVAPALTLVFNLAGAAVIWVGGNLVGRGQLRIGDLTACLAYVTQILLAVMAAATLLMVLPVAQVSAARIREVVDTPGALESAGAAGPARGRAGERGAGTVEFRGVEFRYPGAADPVLRDVRLRLPAGTTTAVVGGLGSGKSTLVGLLLRLHEPTRGEILLDGVDLRSLPRQAVWASVAVVPQVTALFRGTVESNVRFGWPSASPDQVRHALDVAQASDVVSRSPEGLHARVERAGSNLSGGQRQRLAVARALVRPARVYVFDDSFSALDQVTARRLGGALETELAGATVLHVTPRLSVARRADQIVVLDGGTVAGTGTHEDLLRDCPAYRQLMASQLEEASSG